MKNKVIRNTIILSSLLILSACGNNTETGTESPTNTENGSARVTIWADDPNFNVPIMEKAVEMYSNDEVEINVEETTDYMTKLTTVLSSGEQEGLPNIVRIQDYDGRKYIESYPESFINITDYIDYSEFASYKENIVAIENESYGIPFDSGVAGLFYRRDIFEEAGFTEDDLANITWEEFIEIGKQVKDATGKDVLGYGSPLNEDIDTLRILMQSAGTWYFDENGEINLVGNDGIKDALLIMKELADSGIAMGYADFNGRNEAIFNGELASVAQGSWFGGTLKSIEDQSGLWGIAPVPRIGDSPNYVNASNQGGSSWYILNTGNDNETEASIDFMIEMFAGNQEFYSRILEEHSAVSTYLPAQEGEVWEAEDEFFNGQEINQFFSEKMKEIPEVSYGTQSSEVEEIFRTHLTQFYNGNMNVDELLQTVEDNFTTQFGY